MMRGILSLALVLMTSAHVCELDGSNMVAHGFNAALDIWAASKRCHGTLLKLAPVKCERDVASSIQELSAFGGAITEMVGSCGNINLENHACAVASNQLVSALAGLAASGGAIADDCAHVVPSAPAGLDDDILDTATALGKCTSDAGNSMNSIFQASNTLKHVQNNCGNGKGCTVEALDVVSVLSNFGSYIAESYNDCSAYHAISTKTVGPDTTSSECSADILAGIAELSALAKLGLTMKDACASSGARLYLDTKDEQATTATGSLTSMALAACVAVGMVVSFVAGRRFGKARPTRNVEGAELLEAQVE
jgi:hypothetical protein